MPRKLGCTGNAVFRAKALMTHGFGYRKYMDEVDTEDSLEQWTAMSARYDGEMMTIRTEIARKTTDAKAFMARRDKASMTRCLRDRQRLNQRQTALRVKQDQAETMLQTLNNKDLELERIDALKSAARVIIRVHPSADISGIEDSLVDIQGGIDNTNDVTSALDGTLHTGDDMLDDDDLFAAFAAEQGDEAEEELDRAGLSGRAPLPSFARPAAAHASVPDTGLDSRLDIEGMAAADVDQINEDAAAVAQQRMNAFTVSSG
jgi:Skp family chaperone for outer membrane proteins